LQAYAFITNRMMTFYDDECRLIGGIVSMYNLFEKLP
jgi:hypothetical protein